MKKMFLCLVIVFSLGLAVKCHAAPFLVWNANPADQQVTKYIVYQDAVKIGETIDNSYDLQGIRPGQYTFTVTATNVWGESGHSDPCVSPALAGNVGGVNLIP